MTTFFAARPRWRHGVAVAVALLAVWPGAATPALPPADAETVARIESWLNEMRTMRSQFVQTSSNGSIAEGTIWLKRPGKLRIDYQPPVPLQVYTDGIWLVYVDTELKEANQVPLSATPAAYLVREKIELSGDINVERVTRRRGTVSLHMAQVEDPDAGRLVLTFAEQPLTLRGWTVIDAQGVETTVTLIGPAINPTLPPDTFEFAAPDWAPKQQRD